MSDRPTVRMATYRGETGRRCPCGTSLEGRRANVLYCSPKCRTAAYKDRHRIIGYRPVKASLNGNGRSGRQVSYRRAVRELAGYLASLSPLTPESVVVARAEQVLARALPDRQRRAA